MSESKVDFEHLLKVLTGHGVEFLVVGGVAAFLQGAPVFTLDLDVVRHRTRDNLARLLAALADLDACCRLTTGARLAPQFSHPQSSDHQRLITSAGPLDVLGAIGQGETYEDLRPGCHEVELSGMGIRILNLADLVRIKEQLGQPKDRAVLEILKETLRIATEADGAGGCR